MANEPESLDILALSYGVQHTDLESSKTRIRFGDRSEEGGAC